MPANPMTACATAAAMLRHVPLDKVRLRSRLEAVCWDYGPHVQRRLAAVVADHLPAGPVPGLDWTEEVLRIFEEGGQDGLSHSGGTPRCERSY